MGKWSAPKNRQEHTQHNAENDARDDGKIKCRMPALYTDVARQSSQPLRRVAAPHYQAHQRYDDADDDHEFSQLAHRTEKVARIAWRHKVESRWRSSLEIITKRLVSRRRQPRTKFAPLFASLRGNIIPMSPRTKRRRKRNSKRSMKPTRY